MADGEARPLLKRDPAERARDRHGPPLGPVDDRDAKGRRSQDPWIRRRLKEREESWAQLYITGAGGSTGIDEHVDSVRRNGEARIHAARSRGASAVRDARSEADDLVERADGSGRALVRDAESEALTLPPTEAAGHVRAAEREWERGVGLASARGRDLADRAQEDSTAEVRRIEAACAQDDAKAGVDADADRPEARAAVTERLRDLGRQREELRGLLGTRMPRGGLRSLPREDRRRERTSPTGLGNRLAAEGLRGTVTHASCGEQAPPSGRSPLRAREERSGRVVGRGV